MFCTLLGKAKELRVFSYYSFIFQVHIFPLVCLCSPNSLQNLSLCFQSLDLNCEHPGSHLAGPRNHQINMANPFGILFAWVLGKGHILYPYNMKLLQSKIWNPYEFLAENWRLHIRLLLLGVGEYIIVRYILIEKPEKLYVMLNKSTLYIWISIFVWILYQKWKV